MEKFSQAMIDGCNAALDAKVFYQDAFADFVITRMGGYDCEASFVAHLDLKWHGEFWADSSEKVKQHANQLQFAPRGHYVTITKDFGDGRVTHAYLMSDGKGYLAGQHDFYDEPVTPGHMLKRMLGYEIYGARKQLETERFVAEQKASLGELSFQSGKSSAITSIRVRSNRLRRPLSARFTPKRETSSCCSRNADQARDGKSSWVPRCCVAG